MIQLDPPTFTIPEFTYHWRNWLNNLYEYLKSRETAFISADSLNVVSGGSPTGDVTDVQTLLDGNVYILPELAATPGFELEFNFTGIKSITGFVSKIRYDGLATHDVSLGLYNYTDAQYDAFVQISSLGAIYSYRTIEIPDGTKYIDSSNNAKMILLHESPGNASHDVRIDYVALIGTRA